MPDPLSGAGLRIDLVTPAGVSEATTLLDRFFREEGFPLPAEGLETRIRRYAEMPGHAVFLVHLDTGPAGVGTVVISFGLEYGWLAELEDLYVLPEARGAGVARRLVEHAARWASEQGCSAMLVTITPEGQESHDLIGFYSHLGFADRGRRMFELQLTPKESGAAAVQIVDADPQWPTEFERIARELRMALGMRAVRIDHIGSTAVPAVPAKDVIDIQVSVEEERALREVVDRLQQHGWLHRPHITTDHPVPGFPETAGLGKAFLRQPDGIRRANLHVRIVGYANQRYALLFRDYLRAHPPAADAYARFKRGLAALAPDLDTYADLKDPACDLIYLAAEDWARASEWDPGPSDA